MRHKRLIVLLLTAPLVMSSMSIKIQVLAASLSNSTEENVEEQVHLSQEEILEGAIEDDGVSGINENDENESELPNDLESVTENEENNKEEQNVEVDIEQDIVTDENDNNSGDDYGSEYEELSNESTMNEDEGTIDPNPNNDWAGDDEIVEPLENEVVLEENAHGMLKDENKSIIESGTCGTNLTWSIEEYENGDLMKLNITGTGKMSDYSFDGGPWSEYASDICEVYVSEGVESIGDFAFYKMNMNTVTLPDSVQTIGLRAFQECTGITEISLPDSLKFIGAWAFSGCDGLTSIEFPEREMEVQFNAFSYCDSLQTIIIPDGIQFDNHVFEECTSIRNVYISKEAKLLVSTNNFVDIFPNCPEVLTIIGYTYSEAYYFALHYNYNFESIGEKALTGTCGENLQWNILPETGTLNISGSGEMYDYLSDDDSPWTYCQDLVEHIIVNEGVTSIGAYAFYELDNLADISMPDSIEELHKGCISYNAHISQIEIPKGVKKIHCKAILACPSLKKLIYNAIDCEFVPDYEYTSDIDKQYAICASDRGMKYTPGNSVTELTIGRDVKNVPAHVIEPNALPNVRTLHYYAINCEYERNSTWSQLYKIDFGNEVEVIPSRLLYGNQYIRNIVIPDSVTTIGASAFSNMQILEYLYIPEGAVNFRGDGIDGKELKTAGPVGGGYNIEYAWKDCIPSNAFSNSRIISCTFADGIKTIGDDAFRGCTKLEKIEFPDSLEKIGKSAFYYSGWLTSDDFASLESVEIPETVNYIGDDALPGMSYGSGGGISWYFRGEKPYFEDEYDFREYKGMKYIPSGESTWDNLAYLDTVKRWTPLSKLFFEGTYEGVMGANTSISATWVSETAPDSVEWSSTDKRLSFSGSSILGPFEGEEGPEYYISSMVTAEQEGYYDITVSVNGKKADTTLYVTKTTSDRGSIKITPGPITLRTGQKYVIKAAYYDESGNLAEASGGIYWSTISGQDGGEVSIKPVSDYYEYCLCEVVGTKTGTCGVFANTEGGLSAPVTIYVKDSTDNQKKYSASTEPTGHLSGSKNYELIETEKGTIDLTAPITSKVIIDDNSNYNSTNNIVIKKNGELIVNGKLNANTINIKEGGKLSLSRQGLLNAETVIVEGGGWFNKSGGCVQITDSSILKTSNMTIKGKGKLEMADNAQLIVYSSFNYNGAETNSLAGTLFVGGSMDIGKTFMAPDTGFVTVFYGDTTANEFSVHNQSRFGQVYAGNAERYNAIGLSPDNIVAAMQYLNVNTSSSGAWSYTPSNTKFETNWAQGVGAWYQNLAAARETVCELNSYQNFTKADCVFVSKLADMWVTSVSGQLVKEGFTQQSSGTFDLVFKLHNKSYKIHYIASGSGAYGNYGSVWFGDAKEGDDNLTLMGMTAAASTENFWSQATAYLAEDCVKQYYQFVKGSLPKGKSEADLKGILKKKGKDYAKKYFEKVLNKYLFSALKETQYGADVSQIQNAFKVSELVLNGDIEGLWKYAVKTPKKSITLKSIQSFTSRILTNSTTEMTESSENATSNTVKDEYFKKALIDLLGQDNDGNPDFSKAKDVEYLDLSGRFIQSIEGIQEFTNLKTLILENNEIENLEPLRDLAHIQYLDVSGQGIKDFSDLAGLKNLLYLDISDNDIASMEAISSMSSLNALIISDTNISSFEPLEKLDRIQIIQADNIPFGQADLGALRNVHSLKELYMSNSGLQSLEGINTDSLQILNISGNSIQSLQPICNASKLVSADFSDNIIDEIPSLKNCTELTTLSLSGNLLTVLSGVAEAPAISELYVSDCWLIDSDMEYIAQMPSIEKLDLSHNDIEDISLLFKVNSLSSVNITDTETDLGEYEDLPDRISFEDMSALGSGSCGNNSRWMVTGNGRLIIYGTGEMDSYTTESSGRAPWKDFKIREIHIGEGITKIGDSSFYSLSDIKSVYIPSSVREIGEYAFYNCRGLHEVVLLESVIDIAENAFLNCSEELLLYVKPDSFAEEYAKANDIALNYFGVDFKDIKDAIIEVKPQVYSGKIITPVPTVLYDEKPLRKDVDYIVTYENNINVGTGTVIIQGAGVYIGQAEQEFTITKAPQSISVKVAASKVSVGEATTVDTTGARGTLSFKSSNASVASVDSKTGKITAKKIGTVKITATASETTNYKSASKAVTINVVPAATASLAAVNQATGIKLTWKKVTGATGYLVYRNGAKIATISKGTTVTYTDKKANTNGTKYTFKIVAKATTGNSTLSKSLVRYRVSRPTISSLSNRASKKMTVKWGKNTKASGYQVQYSLNSSFKSPKTVTISKNATVSKVIGSLTKGKKYYVRIRSFKTVNGNKHYSVWSVAKATTIKK